MFEASRVAWLATALAVLLCAGKALCAGAGNEDEIRIVELQGTVEVSPAGAKTWVLTQTNQLLYPFDHLRTGTNSRVALRWSDRSVVAFGASTELEILQPHAPGALAGLRLVQGVLSFLHRDEPSRIRVVTRGAVAGVEGTEFVLAVSSLDGVERSTLSVIDGRVHFGNDSGTIVLRNGEQAVVEVGRPPTRTAGFIANNVLQWCFYYPAVLNTAELPLTAAEAAALRESLEAYGRGDLLAALRLYPAGATDSDAVRVYHAALMLSVGEVTQTEAMLAGLADSDPAGRIQRLAGALRRLIAAVKRETISAGQEPQLSSEFVAETYYQQAQAVPETSLRQALALARQAVAISPEFGFAWERVAEVELCFGRRRAAIEALDKSLELSPRNAQALALKGYLLAAQGRSREAMHWFDQALAVDSALGNAWLGRGLCRIRRGDLAGGREDLLVAAALEPRRAELRSYLGKATGAAGEYSQAIKELQLARNLDPNDPTAWLYSALINQQHNRINEAIRDLEKSQQLNDNRSVYRSRLLLDQDQSVRSADLAGIYQDAGMADVAVREAGRAVNYDYGNYSAHLFLASSLNPGSEWVNRRYETAAVSESLLANLLSPASAGTLSSGLSQARSSWLFEQDRFGLLSETEYLSRGAWDEWGIQYGISERLSYGLNWQYTWDPGQHVNGDSDFRRLGLRLKAQVSPADTLTVEVSDFELKYGDLQETYGLDRVNPDVRFEETQWPEVVVGYHHEWNPGVHTLVLASYLNDSLSFTNTAQPIFLATRHDTELEAIPNPDPGKLSGVTGLAMHQDYEGSVEFGSAELQQIWQQTSHNSVIGVRFQYGILQTAALQNQPSTMGHAFPDPPEPSSLQNLEDNFKRLTVYGYHQWDMLRCLQLSGGLAYDWLAFPENGWNAPLSFKEDTVDQLSPKAGVIWTPAPGTVARFAYTRSLGGMQMDQSLRLEPSQVAGFVQAFRSVIPESMVGGNAGAQFETFGLALEQRLVKGTYLSVAGELLNSEVQRTLGAYDSFPAMDNPDNPWSLALPARLRNHLDYQEPSVLFTVNQLLGREWALGARYRLSQATLESDFVDVRDGLVFRDFQPRYRQESLLHTVDLTAVFNHSCGLTVSAEALWFLQNTDGYMPGQPGDNFWQFNVYAGYRFPRRRAEVAVGLLNLTDQSYNLSSLNLHRELPQERTLAVRFRINL